MPLTSQFRDFQVLWWKLAIFNVSFSKPEVSFSSKFISLYSVMKDNCCTFFGQTLKTLHNSNKWKCKFLRLSNVWVHFHQVLVIFGTTDQFLCNLMTLKSDTMFKEKLICSFKHDIRNLMNFHPTTQTFKNFTSMGSFCPKYKGLR